MDKSNYTVKEGSTIITLNADYVKNMVAGEYEFSLEFVTGFSTVTIEFEPIATSQKDDESTTADEENPKTDATSHYGEIIFIFIVAFILKKSSKILISK